MADRVQLTKPLSPNATIGIIGGGQLGRMLAIAAAGLGFRTLVLEPGADCPASQVCNAQITAAYDDRDALTELARLSDVVTYEFENVPLLAAEIIDQITPLYPPAKALAVSQDRLEEKNFLRDHGVSVAPFIAVDSIDELSKALTEFDGGVLKTRRFGYDGKGQYVFRSARSDDPDDVVSRLGDGSGKGLILEKLIDFTSEFSLIATRALDGAIGIYDPATNFHENGILRRSSVPAEIDEALVEVAKEQASVVLKQLNYVGVLGVEFFATKDGLLVNEIAPRVHNTGHWTVEACFVGQFEQHIRAITGMPLGNTSLHSPRWEMENLLGDEIEKCALLMADENATVTLYGKAEARAGRKMGHITKRL